MRESAFYLLISFVWKNNYLKRGKGDVYDFMLFFNPYIDIFLQEIKTFREKHKIIDVLYYVTLLIITGPNWIDMICFIV